MQSADLLNTLQQQDGAFRQIERALLTHAELWDEACDVDTAVANFRSWFTSLQRVDVVEGRATPGADAAHAFLAFLEEKNDAFDLFSAVATMPLEDRALIAGWMNAPWRASWVKPFDWFAARDGIATGGSTVLGANYSAVREGVLGTAPSLRGIAASKHPEAAMRILAAGPATPAKHLSCFLLQIQGEPFCFDFGAAVEACDTADLAALSGWVFSPSFPGA